MTTTALTASTAATTVAASSPATAAVAAGGNLGKDEFLKLLTTQLQNQDPMNPTDQTSFIGQLAQFSALEQTTNMATALDRYGSSQQAAQSIGLIGRDIEGLDSVGNTVDGTVDSVTIANGKTTLGVGGKTVATGDVIRVK